jgi:hypothetical protein
MKSRGEMDCDLKTFCTEILGKWGFTLADWIYLQQAYEREREIQRIMDERDGYCGELKEKQR